MKDLLLPEYTGTNEVKKEKELADERKATHVCFCYANRFPVSELNRGIKKARGDGKYVVLHIDTSFSSAAAKDHIQHWFKTIDQDKYEENEFQKNNNTISQPETFDGKVEPFKIVKDDWISNLDMKHCYVLAANKEEVNRLKKKLPRLFQKDLLAQKALVRNKDELFVNRSSEKYIPIRRGETDVTICTPEYVSIFPPRAKVYLVGDYWLPERISEAKKLTTKSGKLFQVVDKIPLKKGDYVWVQVQNNKKEKETAKEITSVDDKQLGVSDNGEKIYFVNQDSVTKSNSFCFKDNKKEEKKVLTNQTAVGEISTYLYKKKDLQDEFGAKKISNLETDLKVLKKKATMFLGQFKNELRRIDKEKGEYITYEQKQFALWEVVGEDGEKIYKKIDLKARLNSDVEKDWIRVRFNKKLKSLDDTIDQIDKTEKELETMNKREDDVDENEEVECKKRPPAEDLVERPRKTPRVKYTITTII